MASPRSSSGAGLLDDHLCLGAVAEAAGLDLLLLEVLVDLEEVLDLVAELGRDVVHVVDTHPGGILERDAEDLLVRPLRVGHVKDADDARRDPAAGERRLADEAERIQRVAVLPQCPFHEPVVRRIRHRREQAAVEHDVAGLGVELDLFLEPDGTSTKTRTSLMCLLAKQDSAGAESCCLIPACGGPHP